MGKMFIKGALIFAGAAGLIFVSSSAALADEDLVVHVPFAFMVDGHQLPAGNYRVTNDEMLPVVSVRNADGHHFAFVLTNALSPKDAGSQPELVFERVNGTNYLSRVVGVENEGREVPLPAKILKQEPTHVALLAQPQAKQSGHGL
jgi:hypothetical protein